MRHSKLLLYAHIFSSKIYCTLILFRVEREKGVDQNKHSSWKQRLPQVLLVRETAYLRIILLWSPYYGI